MVGSQVRWEDVRSVNRVRLITRDEGRPLYYKDKTSTLLPVPIVKGFGTYLFIDFELRGVKNNSTDVVVRQGGRTHRLGVGTSLFTSIVPHPSLTLLLSPSGTRFSRSL